MNLKAIALFLLVIGSVSFADDRFPIVLPDQPIPAETTAAAELEQYLEKVVLEFTVDGKTPRIHVGMTTAARAAGFDKLKDEEWVNQSADDTLYLVGGGTRGTLYAVYHILEDQLGIHWLTYDEEYVPPAKDIHLPALKRRGKPFFSFRGISRCFNGVLPDDGGRFATRNRVNFESFIPPTAGYGGMNYFGKPFFVHTFDRYLPVNKYRKAHPEYFTLIDGKRGTNGQLCMSCPELPEVLYAKLLESIEASTQDAKAKGVHPPAYYDLSMSDGSYVCQCPACAAALKKSGGATALLLKMLNPVAKKLAASHPELTLTTLAYLNLQDPPNPKISPEPNLLIRVCDTKSNQAAVFTDPSNRRWLTTLRDWKKLTPRLGIWDYGVTYETCTGFPYPFEKVIGPDMRTYAENRIDFMFWQVEHPALADMYPLRVWMLMKLMEDPYQDAERLYNMFMEAYYGPATEELKQYRELLAKDAQKNRIFIDWTARTTAYTHLNAFSIPAMQTLFDQAEQKVTDNKIYLERVRRARIGLDRATYMLFPLFLCQYEKAGLARESFPLDRAKILERAKRYRLAAVEKLNPRWSKTNQQLHDEVTDEIERYAKRPVTPRIPSKFKDVPHFDYPATEIDVSRHLKKAAILIDAPDTEAGQVLKLSFGKKVPPKFHIPLPYGIYIPATRRELPPKSIPKVKGRGYHWYKLATVKPQASMYVYLTGDWYIKFHVGNPTPGVRG